MQILKRYVALIALIVVFSQCKKEEEMDFEPAKRKLSQQQNPPTCKDSLLPVVMMHGFLASGDTYAKHFMRFTSNGYCGNRLFAYDWNTLGGGGDVNLLDDFIDDVLAQTGASQVNLMGHSAGGGLGYSYLDDATRAAKVAHYVHIGSGVQPGPAGPNGEIPTLNLWSDGDEVASGGDITGATNVMLSGQDHYQVATSEESFHAIYKFFNNDEEPQTLDITQEAVPCVSGKALTFGENNPVAGATINVFEVNAATGERLSTTPDTFLIADATGSWGPFAVKLNSYYEFEVTTTTAGDRVVHYYREPFTRTVSLVYLRTLPPAGSLAGLILASLPKDDDQTVLAVFSSSQAVIDTRDNLTVNGFELATSQYAPASETAIAFFLYDNGDSQSSGNSIATFNAFPFLAGVDLFFPTTPAGTIALELNGRTMNVWSWKSETEGVVVPVFD